MITNSYYIRYTYLHLILHISQHLNGKYAQDSKYNKMHNLIFEHYLILQYAIWINWILYFDPFFKAKLTSYSFTTTSLSLYA